MGQEPSDRPWSMRELFAKQADPYADADRAAARRWAGLLFLVQSGLVAAADIDLLAGKEHARSG